MTQRRWLFPLLVLLAACQLFQSPPANTSEAIGAAEATMTTVAHDVHDAKLAGLITPAEADRFKQQLQAAQNNIVVAIDAYAAGDTVNANDRVQATHLVLQTIIQALKDRGAKTHG